jgi:DHA1 family bicyclomycin/chloramphenicol resistance-like MFS transporter
VTGTPDATSRHTDERRLIPLLAGVTAVGPVALNIYLPILPAVRADFDASTAAASLTVSAPLVAYAVGILVYGTLSDRLGRRPVILFGLAVYLLGTMLAAAAPGITLLMLGRVVQALGSAAGVTVARAIVGDLFPRERMARTIAYLTMVMVIGNSLAPAAGGALAQFIHWRAIFVLMLAASVAITIWTWRALPETRRFEAGATEPRALVAASASLLRRPSFLACVLQSGIIYATFLVFISFIPYVMVGALGHTTTEYGLWYLSISVGYFIGNWGVTRMVTRLGVRRMVFSGVLIQAGGTALAWAIVAAGLWDPWWLFLPWTLVAFGQGLALPNVTATAVSLMPGNPGVVSSLLGCLHQLIGALAVQVMSGFPTTTPMPVATFCLLASLVGVVVLRFQPRAEAPH